MGRPSSMPGKAVALLAFLAIHGVLSVGGTAADLISGPEPDESRQAWLIGLGVSAVGLFLLVTATVGLVKRRSWGLLCAALYFGLGTFVTGVCLVLALLFGGTIGWSALSWAGSVYAAFLALCVALLLFHAIPLWLTVSLNSSGWMRRPAAAAGRPIRRRRPMPRNSDGGRLLRQA